MEAARVLRGGGTFGIVYGGRTSTPQWHFYGELLGRYGAYAEGEPLLPPVAPVGDAVEVLSSAGLVEIEVTECEIHVPMPDGETFLRGELAHAYRSMFDAVPAPDRQEMEQELLVRLEELRGDEGIVLDRVAVFAKGRKPRP